MHVRQKNRATMSTYVAVEHLKAMDFNSGSSDGPIEIGNSQETSGDVVIGQPTSTMRVRGTFDAEGPIVFNSGTANSFTLPSTSGSVGQVLTSTGAQQSVWSNLPSSASDQIQDALGTTRLSCQVPGSIDGFLPFSSSQPLFHVGSAPDITYLGNGTDPLTSTSFVAATDNISLFKNSVQRVAVRDTEEVMLSDPNGTPRVIVNPVGGTQIASENGVGVDYFAIDSSGIFMAHNTLPVFYVLGSSFRLWSPGNSTVLRLQDGLGVNINASYYLPTGDGSANQVITTNGAGTSTWATPLGMTVGFGGDLNNLVDVYVYNGLQASVCSSGASTRGNVFVVPSQCRINAATYDTQSGDASTELGIYVNGSLATQFSLSGPRGVATGLSVTVAQGDVVAVGCVVLPAPDQSTVTLYMSQ